MSQCINGFTTCDITGRWRELLEKVGYLGGGGEGRVLGLAPVCSLLPGYREGTTSALAHPLCHDSLLYFSPKAMEPETVALNQESKEIFPSSGVLLW